MSMRKNFAYLAKSKYLICIALIVLTYNVAINLIEVVWKNQIKATLSQSERIQCLYGRSDDRDGNYRHIVAVFITGNDPPLLLDRHRHDPCRHHALDRARLFHFRPLPGFRISHWIAALIGSTPLVLSVLSAQCKTVLAEPPNTPSSMRRKRSPSSPSAMNRSSKEKRRSTASAPASANRAALSSTKALLLIFSTVRASTPLCSCHLLCDRPHLGSCCLPLASNSMPSPSQPPSRCLAYKSAFTKILLLVFKGLMEAIDSIYLRACPICPLDCLWSVDAGGLECADQRRPHDHF